MTRDRPPPVSPVSPIYGAAVFGVMANLCYLLGPAVELAMGAIRGRSVLPTGPALYCMGLTFSVGVALFPALLAVLIWCTTLLGVVLF